MLRYDFKPARGPYQIRYWSIVNAPILGEDGYVRWILIRAEDVSELTRRPAAAVRHCRTQRPCCGAVGLADQRTELSLCAAVHDQHGEDHHQHGAGDHRQPVSRFLLL